MRATERLFMVSVLIGACARARTFQGVDVSTGGIAVVAAAPMHPGRTFSGDYQSAQTGSLHLDQHDDQIDGSFSYWICNCHVAGNLHGKIEDNVARIKWAESVAGDCPGSLAVRRGDGYLLYEAPAALDGYGKLFGQRVYLHEYRYGERSFTVRRPPTPWVAFGYPKGDVPTDAPGHCP